MERVLITGGAGFLGRHLVPLIAGRLGGRGVRALDILEPRPSFLPDDVAYLGGIDILDGEALEEAFRGVEAVVHLAGLVSFRRADRARLFALNEVGSRKVARACLSAGVGRLVHISSVAAVGFNNREHDPADESLPFDWGRVRSKYYMRSKRAGERALRDAAAAGLSVVIANPGAMHGPGNRQFAALFEGLQQGRLRFVPPGGTNVVDVRDVAEGLYRLLLSDARNERFILGAHNLRYSEIVGTMARCLGAREEYRVLPSLLHRPLTASIEALERLCPHRLSFGSDLTDSWFQFRYFTSRKAERRLGWRPRFSFEETTRDCIREMIAAGILRPPGKGGGR